MNTGAILNRINFGLTVAAGRLPGASLARWSDAERLRNAPREEQVDGVVNAFLGGHVSPDTRQILLSGENPMVAKFAAAPDSSAASMMTEMSLPGQNGQRRPMTPQTVGQPIQLSGLAQVVGLAIGAPEFQRR
jgi:hypothetical protein